MEKISLSKTKTSCGRLSVQQSAKLFGSFFPKMEFLKFLLSQIRGETNKFTSCRKMEENKHENRLKNEIHFLETIGNMALSEIINITKQNQDILDKNTDSITVMKRNNKKYSVTR